MAILISKRTPTWGLSWAVITWVGLPHLPARILKVYAKALTGFSHVYCPDVLNNTLLSSGCDLENGSHCGNGEQNANSKDTGGREEPLIAQIRQQPGSLTDLLQQRYMSEYKPYNNAWKEILRGKKDEMLHRINSPLQKCLYSNSRNLSMSYITWQQVEWGIYKCDRIKAPLMGRFTWFIWKPSM